MDYTTLTPEGIEAQTLTPAQTQSLYEVCRQIVDGRAARGKQYELAGLLIVLVLAKLAGMKSLLGASEWARDQQKRLCQQLKLCWRQMPCANTYKYALARLESQQVNAQFAAWLVRKEAESRCGDEPSRLARQSSQRSVHLAIDGKVLKGTGKQVYGGEKPQKHILHVYEVQTGIVLHQCPIDEKRNEVSTLKPLLTEVLCKGRILTADAAQSYHEFGRLVQRAGGPGTASYPHEPRSQRVPAPRLGRGGAGISSPTRTQNARNKQCGDCLWVDQPFLPPLSAQAALPVDSRSLGRGKSAALAA